MVWTLSLSLSYHPFPLFIFAMTPATSNGVFGDIQSSFMLATHQDVCELQLEVKEHRAIWRTIIKNRGKPISLLEWEMVALVQKKKIIFTISVRAFEPYADCHGSVSCFVLCFDFHALLCPFSVSCVLPSVLSFLLVACPPVCLSACCSSATLRSPAAPPHLFLVLSSVSVCVVFVFPLVFVSSFLCDAPRVSSLPFGTFWILIWTLLLAVPRFSLSCYFAFLGCSPGFWISQLFG